MWPDPKVLLAALHLIMIIYIMMMVAAANLGGLRGPVPPFQFFCLYVTATINSMKISFNDV